MSETEAKSKMKKPKHIHCSFSEIRLTEELLPKVHPKNPNKHPKRQITLLAKILTHQGFRNPITVSKRSGFIVAGHGRLLAAQEAGLKEVPVDLQDFETEADEYAHMVADNKIADYAELQDEGVSEILKELQLLEFDLDLAGYDNEAMKELLGLDDEEKNESDADAKTDEAASLAKKWNTQKGQRWQCGNHFVFCGNSMERTDVEKLMGGNLASVVMTSPPYAQQREYGEASELVKDWDSLMLGVFDALLVTDDAQLLVNLGLIHEKGEVVQYWHNWIQAMRERAWKNIGWYVWDQGGGFPGASAGRLGSSHEFVFHFGKKMVPALKVEEKAEGSIRSRPKSNSMGRRKNGDKSKITTPESSLQPNKIPDSVARVRRGNPERLNHPAVYPVKLPLYFIRAWLGIIYDPFLGSGTTLIAAEQSGRVCYGMEIDPDYVAVILQRFSDATGTEPVLVK